ncbi:Ig-like domain-containing protein [Bacillus mesophilum]|uniref:SLH domain-containing protein n=1 Tax=Bacillus mesophilum TaxID=1071718 RepID=A0A7V7UV93_9BACI|nr:Ig-like domain-containing protein [Bacillus mesophilum]KAB2332572.1 hypothetical protein F7732_10780 [Bacillus mesophilum]
MAYQPKSYRKFVATAATATLVAGVLAPAVSAASFTDVPERYQDAVDFVVSKGVQGFSDTQFGTGENIKRVDAAVMVAKVVGLDTESAPAAGFTDVPARAQGAVNALKAAGITSGKSTTSFGAQDLITRGELAIWIDRAFNLEGSADHNFTDVADRYAEAVEALVANEITNGVSATQFGVTQNAKRGDFAIFLHRASNVTPDTPEVIGVSSANLTQFTVNFNTAVDKDTATDKSNYTFDGKALADNDKVELSGDAQSVVITLNTQAANQTSKEVTVKNVKTTAGAAVPSYKGTVNFADFTAPTVTSVASAGPAKFKVTFSEPVDLTTAQTASNYVINDGQYFIKSVTRTSLNTVEVELYSTLANGEYSVKVSNVTDLAGFKAPATTVKFNQVEDKDAPVVSSVVSASPTEVVLEMSEDVSAVDASKLAEGIYHTNTSNKANNVQIEGKKVTISFTEANKLPNGTAYLYIAKDLFTDGWGNKNAAYNTSLSVVADTTKPTISKVEATADNKFKVTFSEKVTKATAETAGHYSVLDKDGKKVDVTVAPVLSEDGKVVTLTLGKSLTGGTYGLAVEDIKDLADNTIDDVTVNVTVKDTTAPTVTSTGVKYTSKNIVKVSFSEPMATTGNGSVLDLSNYSIAGKYLNTTKAKVSVTDEGKAVLIDLTDAIEANEVSFPTSINVGKVADVSGNFTTAFNTSVSLSEGSEFGISKVEAVDTKTVKVYLDEELAKFEADDFLLQRAGATINPASVTFSNVDGKGVITYTLANVDKLGTNGKVAGIDTLTVITADKNINTANAFGVKIKADHAAVTATDKIAATIATWDHDSNSNTAEVENIKISYAGDEVTNVAKDTAATIKLTFTEALNPSSISTQTFEVAGYTVAGVDFESEGTVVALEVVAKANNTTTKPAVKQASNILDANSVISAAGGSWTVTGYTPQ